MIDNEITAQILGDLGRISGQLAGLDQRLTEFGARVTRDQARLETRADAHGRRLDSLEQSRARAFGSIAGVSAAIAYAMSWLKLRGYLP